MKTKFTNKFFLILILTVLLSFNLLAINESKSKFGVGLAMDYDYTSGLKSFINSYQMDNPYRFGSSQHILLTYVNGNFKLDLQGMIFNSYRSESGLGDDYTINSLLSDISIGLYFIAPVRDDFHFYYGTKIGTVFSISSFSGTIDGRDESSDENEFISMYINPTIGGEYFFSSHFSVSGELALKLNFLSEDDNGYSTYYISTLSSLLVKWYF